MDDATLVGINEPAQKSLSPTTEFGTSEINGCCCNAAACARVTAPTGTTSKPSRSGGGSRSLPISPSKDNHGECQSIRQETYQNRTWSLKLFQPLEQ